MPRPKPGPKPVRDEPTSPIETAMVEALALSDLNHPMHAYYQVTNLLGVGMGLINSLEDETGVDLMDIKQRALVIAGHAQKVALWCDRMYWNQEQGRVPGD